MGVFLTNLSLFIHFILIVTLHPLPMICRHEKEGISMISMGVAVELKTHLRLMFVLPESVSSHLSETYKLKMYLKTTVSHRQCGVAHHR